MLNITILSIFYYQFSFLFAYFNKIGFVAYLLFTLYWIVFYKKNKGKDYENLSIQKIDSEIILSQKSPTYPIKQILNIKQIHSLIEKDSFLKQCNVIINKHFQDENFSVPSLAAELFIARATLYREITKRTGRTAITFIKLTRLIKAHDLLINTNLPISNIAYEVGFNAHSHFSTSFKKEYGCTPKQMRMAIK